MTEVPVAARIWRRTRTKVAQSQTLLRTTRQLLEAIIASTRLGFVASAMRRRIDAVMPYGEVFLRPKNGTAPVAASGSADCNQLEFVG